MYRWNKRHINGQIDYLKRLSNSSDVTNSIKQLKELRSKTKNIKLSHSLESDDDEYLFFHNSLLEEIINKYSDEQIKFRGNRIIEVTEEKMIDFTKTMIEQINPEWYKKIALAFPYSGTIDINKKNTTQLNYIRYISAFYLSLKKTDTIFDYLNPIKEYLLAYGTLKNPNFFNKLERNFLGILGRMIVSYEMKNTHQHYREVTKADLNILNNILRLIKNTEYREDAALKIPTNEKVDYLIDKYGLNKEEVKDIYSEPLSSNYSDIISYFIAIELFEIYKIDKEKCMYLCDKIITSTKDLENTLNNQNIILTEHSDEYIKELKKEYLKTSN